MGRGVDGTDASQVELETEVKLGAFVIRGNGNHPERPRDRRARARVKVAMRAHLRGGIGTMEVFEDTGKTIDVSRHGLLIETARNGYWVDQTLLVTCPYATGPAAINEARRARVVRTILMPNLRFGVALKFDGETLSADRDPWVMTANHSPVRVLGVDSDRSVARLMRQLLEHDGYQVAFVENARQALDLLRSETPDVLVAEVEGGEICGHDLCAIVKKSERLRHVPVILTTESALPSDYASSHRLGAVMCVRRPCDPVRLQRAIHLVAAPPGHRSVYSSRFNVSGYVRTS